MCVNCPYDNCHVFVLSAAITPEFTRLFVEQEIAFDPAMLKRFNEINELPDKEKECVYQFLDAFLAKQKLQAFLNRVGR